MRAAIYARYSSDLQSEASIDDQIRLCRERVERDGMNVTQVFTDYAISGGTLSNRPGMLSLMDAANRGEFDVVIAEALDRISRDQEDIAAIYKRLNYVGIKISTISEGDVNELHIGLKGTMNALFLKDLAAKIKRGQRGRVEVGKIPGGNSYGYKVIRKLCDNGTVTKGDREIDDEQANIIRRIFDEFIAGHSARQIATHLNADEIPGPTGGLWNASSINGSRQRKNGILNNELYLGWIVYNRQRSVKDPETGKRKFRVNPESEWIRTEVPHLRIIDTDTWEHAQKIKARYSSRAGNKRQTKKRLLTGLVKCGECGGGMTIIRHNRYYCSAKRERGTCNSSIGIAAPEIENRVIAGLRSILIDNENLVETFATEFRAEFARLRKQRGANERHLQKELNKVNNAIKRCLTFITDSDEEPGLVRDELRNLETRKRDIDKAVAAIHEEQVIKVHPNTASLYRKKVGELENLLSDETARPQTMDIIRSLIDHIEVHASLERKTPEVKLVGALAQILAFSQSNGEGHRDLDSTFLMVAEEGLEPPTRGL